MAHAHVLQVVGEIHAGLFFEKIRNVRFRCVEAIGQGSQAQVGLHIVFVEIADQVVFKLIVMALLPVVLSAAEMQEGIRQLAERQLSRTSGFRGEQRRMNHLVLSIRLRSGLLEALQERAGHFIHENFADGGRQIRLIEIVLANLAEQRLGFRYAARFDEINEPLLHVRRVIVSRQRSRADLVVLRDDRALLGPAGSLHQQTGFLV